MDEMDRKWGKGVIRFESAEELCKGCSEMHIDHENVRTAEDEAQYSKEFREGMQHLCSSSLSGTNSSLKSSRHVKGR